LMIGRSGGDRHLQKIDGQLAGSRSLTYQTQTTLN
jgi:hypothetical protein